ncbi:MAG: glycosyl hydrolase [Saprospiraceae bacterium]|nr:glycosyl hydrolase [Saprospiraceae bacterium]MBL0026592.1 glycosyl hydrolase [Saprospiraceae bacterium]
MSNNLFILLIVTLISFNINAQKNKKKDIPAVTEEKPTPLDLNTYFKPVKWRSIGPFRGGRSVAACGVVGDITTYYMGTTGGGLWKTSDLGLNWSNISDGFFKTGSVGAVAVAESDPNIVYVGMGEHPVRGVMTHHGDGVYKSTDAGKTWKKIGLELTQHIARIVVHPKNPDIVFVAAQGALYSKSAERGIFKSSDGGSTWSKVLYIDDKTGCAELSMDMNNPLILYAAMWEHGRLPWKVISGGPGSGLYKSTDGGVIWDKINEGLPKELGKMAISVCRSNSEKVYALVESDSEKGLGGLFVSNNAGKSWSRTSSDNRLIQRAWYYIEVFTDPKDENTLYVMSAPALRSIDGGKSWENLSGQHGDYHNLWINPDNPKNMIISDDGGSCVSVNFGKSWSPQTNMPTGQLYRINVDNQFPYRIYAGQQDNSSLIISSRQLGSGGITADSWTSSAGGESAFLAFNPDDPRYVLGGSYLGTIEVLDTKANASTNIMAAPIQYLGRDSKDMKYRFNWNAPIIWSKHEPNTYYHGSQYLLRTRDMGKSWTEASPDLTRNEKEKQGKGGGPYTNEAVGAENYGTLSYIIESPQEKGVIYTGSDDGLVYLTRDGGQNWQNVTPVGLQECLINAIEVSPHDPATVYIATTRYKFNDHTPALYKSKDYGKTWTNISSGIPKGAFTRVVREDDVRKDMLFAGTETGIYISWNGGMDWTPFQLNLPLTPITDLKIHQGNLIASTSGRAFWILDDLSLFRQFKADTTGTSLYQPSAAMLVNGSSELDGSNPDFDGTNQSRGVNPATGAVIYYHLPDLKETDEISLEIQDEKGNIIRRFSSKSDSTYLKYDGGPPAEPLLSKGKGLNRFVWNLRHATMPGVSKAYIESSYRGHKAIPGKYFVVLKSGEVTKKTELEIKANPLYPTSQKTYMEYDELMKEMEGEVTLMHKTINTIYNKYMQVEGIIKTLPDGEKFKIVKVNGDSLVKTMKTWDEEMIQRKSKAYDDVENFPNKFTANYLFMLNHAESDIPRVNQPTIDLKKELDAEWGVLKSRANEILEKSLPSFNKQLWDAGIGAVWKN